ncbi:putative ribonuclease H-like domain-containing protein [Tanacetum coccineum]
MSSSTHLIIILSDSNIEDAFSSTTTPDYTPASPDYFPASSGNTSSDSSEDLSKDLLTSLTISPFYDDPYMKVMQTYNDTMLPPSPLFDPRDLFLPEEILPPQKQVRFLSSSSTDSSAPPQLPLERIEHMEEKIEGLGNGRLDIVQRDLDADPFNTHLCEEEAAYYHALFVALTKHKTRFLKQKDDRLSGYCWIDKVSNAVGVQFDGDQVPLAFVSHYTLFLRHQGDSIPLNSNDLFTNKLDPNAAHNMMHNVTPQEKLGILWRMILLRLFRNSLLMGKFIAFGQFLSNLLYVQVEGFGFHPRMVAWIMECVSSTYYSISINGTLHGYFKGKQGLSQGDPMSPYLFTLVMEVLTLIIQRRVEVSNMFTYHHYCSKLNIINLCFADDLFLFVHGDVNSAKVIIEALDEFKLVSGLVPSLPKSTAYFCNVLNYVKLDILNILPFEEGKLPVKYLGVPLISTRLLIRDCKELVEKVHNRVRDWKNKSLSAAGRLQLVQSVLSSLHVYWASVFILPSRIMLDLEQLIRGFLWCQGDMLRGKAKVSWEVVCLPKEEGGLGLRRLDAFNKALIITHIWSILTSKESLWGLVTKPRCGLIVGALFPLYLKLLRFVIFIEQGLSSPILDMEIMNFLFLLPGTQFVLEDSRCSEAMGVFSSRVWDHFKTYAGIPNAQANLDSIISLLIPLSKNRFARSVIAKYAAYNATSNKSPIPLPRAPIALSPVLPPSPVLSPSPLFDPRDFFLLEEILPPQKRAHFLSSSSTDFSNPPQVFEIGESSHKRHLERHEEQIETTLNHLDELPLERIEHMEDKIEEQIRHDDEIVLARIRISTLEMIIKDIQVTMALLPPGFIESLYPDMINAQDIEHMIPSTPPRDTEPPVGSPIPLSPSSSVGSSSPGHEANVVKASTCWVWRPKQKVLDHISRHNGASMNFKRFDYGNPQLELQEKGVINSGCSRHMTGNKSYLSNYEEIDGGFVAFGGSTKGGKITGKGKIRTGKLDFEDVYFVKELKFNLFCVSQMCDKKNNVLFTDTECVVLSLDFKLLDENQVLLRVPRKNNIYSVDLQNVVPSGVQMAKNPKSDGESDTRPRFDRGIPKLIGYGDGGRESPILKRGYGGEDGNTLGYQESIDAGQARKKTVSSQEYILLPLLTYNPSLSKGLKDSPYAGFKPSGEEEKKDFEDPGNKDSEVPSTKEPRVNQEKDANVNSTNNINTASDGNITNNVNTVSSTVNATGIKDNAMDCEECHFCYGKIEEEVYVYQPLGFEDPEFLDRVYKRGTIDKTLFIKKVKGDILLVQVYVDDIIFGSTKKSLCTEFEKLMHKKFQMSSMGELTFFLGLQVTQKDDGIFISQDKYMDEILKKFGFSTVKTASTSIETSNPLLKDENAEESLGYLKGSTKFAFGVYGSPFILEAYTDVICMKKTVVAYLLLKPNETVIKEWEDRMERATTTASSLEAEQDSGNINRTQSMATLNESFPQGTNSSRRSQNWKEWASWVAQEDASNRLRKIVDFVADIEPMVNTATTTSSISVSAVDPVTTASEVVTMLALVYLHQYVSPSQLPRAYAFDSDTQAEEQEEVDIEGKLKNYCRAHEQKEEALCKA